VPLVSQLPLKHDWPEWSGVVRYRGHSIAVLDLAKRLVGASSEVSLDQSIILLKGTRIGFAVLVDEVGELLDPGAPNFDASAPKLCWPIELTPTTKGFLLVQDADSLVTQVEKIELERREELAI
jgi:chemotaxis signal transduction protein